MQGKVDKYAEEKEAWKKEKEEWEEERKRLGTWRVRYLDSEEKLKGRIADLYADYDEVKEKHDGMKVEMEDVKSYIIQEHINGFQKGLRQAAFFYKDVDVNDVWFDENKDVVDGVLVDEAGSSPEEDAGKRMEEVDVNVDDEVVKDADQEAT